MALEIKPGKSLAKNLQRIVKSQATKATSALHNESSLPFDEVVHEVRKRFKRLRAVARLARAALGEGTSRRLNHRLRDAARPLGDLRDAKVLVKTLERLAERWPEHDRPAVLSVVRGAIERRAAETRRDAALQGDLLARVTAATERALRDFRRVKFVRHSWDSLAEGLTSAYARCHEAYQEAERERDDDRLHTWRKRVKDLLYQAEILSPDPPVVLSTDETSRRRAGGVAW